MGRCNNNENRISPIMASSPPFAHRVDDLSSDLWQQDWPPRVWVLWKPLSRLMERVTARRANDISTGNPQQLPVSFLPDFTHIPSTWASQQPETSTTGASDPGSDTLVMEMYRDIVRDMTID